jgi:peptidoglycan hydrolase-like protein with peptidoglycan-binding domain
VTALIGIGTVAADASGQPPVQRSSTRSATHAKPVVAPGRFAGLGFDACSAPDQASMDELRAESPYWGVGVYIGGPERTCAQPALDAAWVRTQARRGWHIFPVWVGRQSRCSDRPFTTEISARNAKATAQGVASANQAVRKAKQLGIGKGSTLFLDVEAYDNTTSACNQPVLSYQSGWNARLHNLGWKGGFYSAGSSGIASIGFIKQTQPNAYTLPQSIWISYADGKPSTNVPRFIDNGLWRHQRLHQYRIDVSRTFGDVTLQVDENAIDIGGGIKPPPVGSDCGGVRLTFPQYPLLRRGSSGTAVRAAECLLKQRGLYHHRLGTTFGAAAARATAAFQRKHGIKVSRSVNAPTWVALLSAGPTPLVKRGSVSDRVRFLQRSLVAALGKGLRVDGIFGAGTSSAVRTYQRRVGLDANGIAGRATWKALQSGRH